MKKYTKKFLSSKVKRNGVCEASSVNALKFERRFGLKAALWVEISKAATESELLDDIEAHSFSTHDAMFHGFLAGMVVGAAESKRAIK